MSLSPRGIAWVGGCFIAIVIALSGYDIYRTHNLAITNTGRELDTQAKIIAEQTARSLQAVDVVLRHLVQQHNQGVLPRLNEAELHAQLADLAVGFAQIDGFAVIGADGRVRAASYMEVGNAAQVSVADVATFKYLRANRHEGVLIDTARVSNFDGRWLYPIARRLETPTGAFAGVVAARGRIDYFQDFYRDINMEPGTRTALLHRNSTLLARHPPAPDALGKPLSGRAALLATSSPDGPPLRTKSPIDGADRIGVVKAVPDYPLVVVVTRDADAVLAPWRAQSVRTGARTLGLAAVAVVLLVLLMRQFTRLYKTRESLEAAKERYALAVAGSDDGVWDYDFVGGRVFASARARELSGLPAGPEIVPIEEWFNSLRIHPEDRALRQAALEAHLAGKTPAFEGEWRVFGADGNERWVRVHGLCVRDASGKPYRMAGSISDIDARKRAEEALRASEEQYREIFNAAADAFVLRDAQARVVDVNPAFLEISGYTREEVVSGTRWIFALPEMAEKAKAMHQRCISGESVHFEMKARRKDGTLIDVEMRAVPVMYRGAPHALGMARDITAQKRAQEALRASEEQYRAIFNAAADALVLRDAGARVVDVNPAFLQMTGYTRELLADSPWIFAPPETVEFVQDMHRRTIAGESVHFEMKARRRDGTLIDVETRAVPIRYRGEPHTLDRTRDITAQKRAEAERARLEGQLLQAKKLEAIGTLAGGIAHDFNNILSAALGYGEMAQKEAPAGTPLKRHIDAVMSAGLRAKSLVERILAFSRSGMGQRVDVHVQSVVAEALDLVAASLPAHVRIERMLDAGNAAVLGDATQIHQVVMNLCANGAQAMKSPGTLSVSLDVVERPEAMMATGALARGRYVRLRVSDTGSGIAPHLLERIFDPFFTTKGVGVGTGLGLSLVHGIVTDLGGGIDVESEPGEGAAFTVYLPCCDAVAAPARSEQAIARGAGETILLVDDEEALVRLGEEMLAGLGYEPVGFTSSAAALEAFRAKPQRFQAVLSDETMPEMTGCELAKAICAVRPDIPIVLMSGFVSPALMARARELAIVEVLSKPLVERDIARGLDAALKREAKVAA